MPRRRPAREDPATPHQVLDLFQPGNAHDLSPALWTSWSEAASVTLARVHNTAPPRACSIERKGAEGLDALLKWTPPDDRMNRSHANTTDATEMGAYAVATLAVHAADDWRVIARTPTESGADLWMIRERDDSADAQVRLEVSGIAKGTGASGITALRARLEDKTAQVRKGRARTPGIAAVVGFEVLRVLISEVVER